MVYHCPTRCIGSYGYGSANKPFSSDAALVFLERLRPDPAVCLLCASQPWRCTIAVVQVLAAIGSVKKLCESRIYRENQILV